MIALLTLISLLLWAYFLSGSRPGIQICRLVVASLCAFFFLYTVVAAGFFWADCFRLERTLIVCIAIEAAAVCVWMAGNGNRAADRDGILDGKAGAWRRFLPRVTWEAKSCWIPILIALAALPFTWNKFELYSMGQDQGVYQVKALALMEHDTDNYLEMKEFTKLETDEERQKYLDFIYEQNNFYLPRVESETDTDASHFETITGTIHGLPTYSALLALWGTIFGYADMIGVQTLLYLCAIFVVYFVCENLRLSRGGAAFATAMTAASPIVLWLSKSSLTETGLLLLVCVFLYFLTWDGDHRLCVVPIAVFAFFHISLYAFMPVFVIVLAVMYLTSRDRGFLVSIAGSAVVYGIGAVWAFWIAPYYSYGNYSELGRITGGLLGERTLIPLIVLVCGALVGLSGFLMRARVEEALWERIAWIGQNGGRLTRAAFWMIRIFLALSVLFFVYKGVLQGETTTACEYLQISVYLYMSGLILIPMIYLALFFRPRLLCRDGISVSLVLLFLYCVVMYSMVMRVRILYYYYFARYAALFLPVVFLLGARLLERIGGRRAAILSAAMLLTFLPYDRGLLTQKDHSRCEWEFLGDVCEAIGPEDAFVVGPEEQQIVFIFPVKFLTGCDVYYADEALDRQLSGLARRYEHVYYMDYDTAFEDAYGGSELLSSLRVTKTYTNWNHLSYLDYFNITNPLTPIPLNYVEYRLKLSLYEIAGEE